MLVNQDTAGLCNELLHVVPILQKTGFLRDREMSVIKDVYQQALGTEGMPDDNDSCQDDDEYEEGGGVRICLNAKGAPAYNLDMFPNFIINVASDPTLEREEYTAAFLPLYKADPNLAFR